MEIKKGDILNKEQFLNQDSYAKEEYEGLIVCSDQRKGCYNFGVQLDENRILVVDQVQEDEVEQKLSSWVPQIQQIQRRYSAGNDTQNL